MAVAPVISTDRLVLRPLTMADHESYLAFVTSERARFMGGPHSPDTAWSWLVNDAGQWALQGFGGVAVTLDGHMIGQVSVTQGVAFPEPELGWFLLDGFEGEGYISEAAAAQRDHVVAETAIASLVSYIDPENTGSARIAARLGAAVDPAATKPAGYPGTLVWRHPVGAAA